MTKIYRGGDVMKSKNQDRSDKILDWIKVLAPIFISWPIVALIIIVFFKNPIINILHRFTESSESRAEIGPIKIELSNPVLPPQNGSAVTKNTLEISDLSQEIGNIRNNSPEGITLGFGLAYTIQATIKIENGQQVTLSPRGIDILTREKLAPNSNQSRGLTLLEGLETVRDKGVYLEKDWPYLNTIEPKSDRRPYCKISGFLEVKGIPQIINALKNNMVILASITITNDFFDTGKDGKVIIKLPISSLGGMATCIVGYNSQTAEFKFANHWGTSWGENGFGYIRDTDLSSILGDAYVIYL
jgi:hypothetical protein